MATFQINDDEWYALSGLPHLARETYFVLRRYMDFETGITGIKRKVSLKAITEELYIEPHQGIKEDQPSQQQIRRAIDWLERAGLIERDKSKNRADKQSIFKLVLATRDYSVQNKADSNPTMKSNSNPTKAQASNTNDYISYECGKADKAKTAKADMPPISDIYNYNNTRARDSFSMQGDWLPDEKIISMARRAGLIIPVSGLSPEILGEFINYWLTRPEVERTQDQWQHALINSIKKREAQNAGTSNHKQGSRPKLDWHKNATEEF